MSRQFWQEPLFISTVTGTAVAASTTETILIPNVTIPANYMSGGRCLRLSAVGSYGTTATPTIVFALRWGGVAGTVIAKTAAVTLTSAVGGGASMTALWTAEALVQVRSDGATGTLMSNGSITLDTSTAATAGTVTNYGLTIPLASGSTGGTTPVTATCDFTADTALSFTVLWGTNNAANSIQTLHWVIEALN